MALEFVEKRRGRANVHRWTPFEVSHNFTADWWGYPAYSKPDQWYVKVFQDGAEVDRASDQARQDRVGKATQQLAVSGDAVDTNTVGFVGYPFGKKGYATDMPWDSLTIEHLDEQRRRELLGAHALRPTLEFVCRTFAELDDAALFSRTGVIEKRFVRGLTGDTARERCRIEALASFSVTGAETQIAEQRLMRAIGSNRSSAASS